MRQMEKIQRDFRWNDTVEQRKYHLVRWVIVCKPLSKGGLGICSIENMNKVLLGKWLWRVSDLT